MLLTASSLRGVGVSAADKRALRMQGFAPDLYCALLPVAVRPN